MAGRGIYIPVMGSFRNLIAGVTSESARAARAGARSMTDEFGRGGRAAGQAAGSGIADGIKRAQAEVARASSALANARNAELDKSAAVESATRKLEQATTAATRADERAAQAANDVRSAQALAVAVLHDYGENAAETANAMKLLAETEEKADKAADAATTARNRASDALSRQQSAQRGAASAQENAETRAQALRGAQEELERAQAAQARGADNSARANRRMGDSFSGAASAGRSMVGGLFKMTAMFTGIGSAAAVSGMALEKGFSRLKAIDEAKAKLAGLGHSTEAVTAIMNNASASVKGTAFGLGDAAGLAGTLVASGIQPGQQLESTLKRVADSATIAGADLGEMGLIWGKAAAKGKLDGEIVAQLMERQIPIYDILAKKMGVQAASVADMVSKGKVSFQDFSDAMNDKIGGAALKSGNTFQGSLNNMQAALGRLGAKVLEGPFNAMPGILAKLTVGIDAVGPKLESAFNGAVDGARSLFDFLNNNRETLLAVGSGVGAVTVALVAYNVQQKLAAWGGLINFLRLSALGWYAQAAAVKASTMAFLASPVTWIVLGIGALVAAIVLLWNKSDAFRNFWIGAWEGIKNVVGGVVSWVSDAVSGLAAIFARGDFTGALGAAFGIEEDSPVVGFLLGLRDVAIGTWNAIVAGAQMMWSGLQVIWSAWAAVWNGVLFPVLRMLWNVVLSPILTAVKTGVQIMWTVISTYFKLWVGFFSGVLFPIIRFLWNSVVSPIFSAIGSFIGGFWNGIVKPIFNAWVSMIKDVLAPVINWLWDTIIKPVWDMISNHISMVIDNIIKPAFNGLKDAVGAVGNFFGTVVEGIRTTWDKLKGYAAKPINFVIEQVWNNGLAKGWNKIADFIPGLARASTLEPVAFATGGAVRGPGTSTSDSIPAVLSNGEHVWDALDVSKVGGQGVMYAMRAAIAKGIPFTWDTAKGLKANIGNEGLETLGRAKPGQDGAGLLAGSIPGFKDGGAVDVPAWQQQLARGHEWARSRSGRAYVLGGSANADGGTDCSGYMSGIANVIQGGDGTRQWATMAFNGGGNSQAASGPQGFVQGLGSGFSIGVLNGGPAGGHTAGTLGAVPGFGPTNVESGGSHGNVAYGGPAVGADNGQFPTKYHLPIGGDGAFVSGGAGGGSGPSPESQTSFLRDKVKSILNTAMRPARDLMTSAVGPTPPEWHAIPPKVYDKSLNGAVDGGFDAVGKIGSGAGSLLRSAYDKASSVVGNVASTVAAPVTGALRDRGGPLPKGYTLVQNKRREEEMILTAPQWAKVQTMVRDGGLTQSDAVEKVLGRGTNPTGPGGALPLVGERVQAPAAATNAATQEKPTGTVADTPGTSTMDERLKTKPEKAGAANKGSSAIDFGADLMNQGVDALEGWAQKGTSAGITAAMTASGIPAGGLAGEMGGKAAEAAGKAAGFAVKTGINVARGVTKDFADFFGFGYDEFTDPFGTFRSMIGNVQGQESAQTQTETDTATEGVNANADLAEASIKGTSTTSEPSTANAGVSDEVKKAREENAAAFAALEQVKARGGTRQDALTTLMVGQTESGWKNYANANDAASLQIPHDAVGSDHDSVGYYQQRASWGSTADRMDPRKSTDLFLNQLLALQDRDKMSSAQAAQKVQRSAFADGSNYAANQASMDDLLKRLGIYDTGGVLPHGGLAMNTSGHDEYVVPPKAWENLNDILAGGGAPADLAQAVAAQTGNVSADDSKARGGGYDGPMIQIDKIEANDPSEAAREMSAEARRLGRSNSLIGGR